MIGGFKNFVEIRGLDRLRTKLEKIARVKCLICGAYMGDNTKDCKRCDKWEKKLNAQKK